jgi:hypothetical protein
MSAGFDAEGKNLFQGLLREGETLLRSLTPAEIKIVEGAAE